MSDAYEARPNREHFFLPLLLGGRGVDSELMSRGDVENEANPLG